jgi:hypothetical protein
MQRRTTATVAEPEGRSGNEATGQRAIRRTSAFEAVQASCTSGMGAKRTLRVKPEPLFFRDWTQPRNGRNQATFKAYRDRCRVIGGATSRSQGGPSMTTLILNRRNLLAGGGSVLATGVSGLLSPASAQGVAPTRSMSGGSNNYRKGAAIVERIGKGGFWMSGTVRRAGDGAPLAGQRIQIWAHTTEGQEHEPQSHGATLTDKDGKFRLEMPQIIPIFGQPHGHLAYDSGEFETVFLRPVMRSAKDTSLEAHFVLQRA